MLALKLRFKSVDISSRSLETESCARRVCASATESVSKYRDFGIRPSIARVFPGEKQKTKNDELSFFVLF
jgi:hypothetical protein